MAGSIPQSRSHQLRVDHEGNLTDIFNGCKQMSYGDKTYLVNQSQDLETLSRPAESPLLGKLRK